MPALSTTKEQGNGTQVRLVFCILGSLLALYINKLPAMTFLASATTLYACFLVDIKLMLKVYLALAVILAVCLLGAALLPKIASFPGSRSAGVSIQYAILPSLRMLISANLAISLILTTSTAVLMSLMASLIRANWLFIPLSVALRFIGTFISELSQVREALLIRSRRSLPLIALTKPWLFWRGFLVPMTFRALGSADELAIAVEMKGIDRKAMGWKRENIIGRSDIPLLVIGLAVAAVALILQCSGQAPEPLMMPGRMKP